MKHITEVNLTIENPTEEYFTANGFKPMAKIKSAMYYRYTFPVVKFGRETVFYCELLCKKDDNHVSLSVFNNASRIYPLFLHPEQAVDDDAVLLAQIEQNIYTRLKKLGIRWEDKVVKKLVADTEEAEA